MCIRDRLRRHWHQPHSSHRFENPSHAGHPERHHLAYPRLVGTPAWRAGWGCAISMCHSPPTIRTCLLYTSDAADDM
eukprot:8484682-Prorocentrum_lima.AAC.1